MKTNLLKKITLNTLIIMKRRGEKENFQDLNNAEAMKTNLLKKNHLEHSNNNERRGKKKFRFKNYSRRGRNRAV